MVVLFATLGFTPQPVLAPLRTSPDFTEMHVFFGPPGHPDGKEPLREVRTTCKALGIKLHEYPIQDAYDYSAFLASFADALQKVEDRQIAFNVSGGTRIMVMAATIFCFTNDLPLLYYNEDSHAEGKMIPLRAFRSLRRLGETPRAIVARLQRWGPCDMGTLAADLKIHPGTLTPHIQVLVNASVVTVQREGNRKIVHLVPDLQEMDVDTVPQRKSIPSTFDAQPEWLSRLGKTQERKGTQGAVA